MINVSAYGQDGPYRDRIGFDPIGQALGGMMSLTGFPGDPPTKTFFPLIDRITALHATIGALAALHERGVSGRGQTIDVSLADSGFTANEIPIAAYLADGTIVEREGNGRGLTNVYQTKDGWALLHATSDAIWPRVCEALDWTGWGADPGMASRRGRDKRLDEIGIALDSWFAQRTTKEAVDHLSRFSVPAAPVNSIEQAAADPHVHEREVLVEMADPYAGSIHVSGKTIKFGRTPMEVGPATDGGRAHGACAARHPRISLRARGRSGGGESRRNERSWTGVGPAGWEVTGRTSDPYPRGPLPAASLKSSKLPARTLLEQRPGVKMASDFEVRST